MLRRAERYAGRATFSNTERAFHPFSNNTLRTGEMAPNTFSVPHNIPLRFLKVQSENFLSFHGLSCFSSLFFHYVWRVPLKMPRDAPGRVTLFCLAAHFLALLR